MGGMDFQAVEGRLVFRKQHRNRVKESFMSGIGSGRPGSGFLIRLAGSDYGDAQSVFEWRHGFKESWKQNVS